MVLSLLCLSYQSRPNFLAKPHCYKARRLGWFHFCKTSHYYSTTRNVPARRKLNIQGAIKIKIFQCNSVSIFHNVQVINVVRTFYKDGISKQTTNVDDILVHQSCLSILHQVHKLPPILKRTDSTQVGSLPRTPSRHSSRPRRMHRKTRFDSTLEPATLHNLGSENLFL